MISPISSFEIISAVCCANSERRVPNPKIFLWIPAPAAYAATVNHNGMKTLLANFLSGFFIKGKEFLCNRPRSLSRNLLD